MHITLPSRAQHDTLSNKGIVIFDDNDATGLDNQGGPHRSSISAN